MAAPFAQAGEPGPSASSASSCVEQVVLRVQTFYEGVEDLEASFDQTTRSAMLAGSSSEGAEASAGRVAFAKPGKMRWAYERPRESLVVSDGTTLWIHDPAAKEVQRLSVTQGYLSGAALQFLLGEGKILESFRVSAERCGPEVERVELVLLPREPASYERLGLTVDGESAAVVGTEVVDLFGNVTRIAFSEIRTNLSPPASTFTFEPPPGTRLIDLSPPRSRTGEPGPGARSPSAP